MSQVLVFGPILHNRAPGLERVFQMSDACFVLIIELAFYAAFAHWVLCLSVSSTITPESLWWLTHLRYSPLVLRITVLRLLRVQSKDDTRICIETHEGPLGPF